MAAAVAVDDGMLIRSQACACLLEHGIGKPLVGRARYRPCRQGAVEAVEHGTEIGLACGDGELGDVGEPQEVREACGEVALRKVLGGICDLALVGAVGLSGPLARDLHAPSRMMRLTTFSETTMGSSSSLSSWVT